MMNIISYIQHLHAFFFMHITSTSTMGFMKFCMLPFLKAGCCKPPITCQMQYVNATFWEKQNVAEDSSYPYDSDCDTWTNDQGTLCYNCNSCKDGFLSTLQGKWWTLGFFLVVMALVLIVSHLLLFLASMLEHYAI